MNNLPDEIIYSIGQYLPIQVRINIFFKVCGRKNIIDYFNENENYCLLSYCIKNKYIYIINKLKKKINIFIEDYKYLYRCVETSKSKKIMKIFLNQKNIYNSLYYEKSLFHCIQRNHFVTLTFLMNLDTLIFTDKFINNILFYYINSFKNGVVSCYKSILYFLQKIPEEQYINIIKLKKINSCYLLHVLREIPLEILIKKTKVFYAIYRKEIQCGDLTKHTGISLINYKLHRDIKNSLWKIFYYKHMI